MLVNSIKTQVCKTFLSFNSYIQYEGAIKSHNVCVCVFVCARTYTHTQALNHLVLNKKM